MLLVALLIGAILIVVALRGTQNELFAALMEDVPAYVVWAAAIVAIGAIGVIPGLKPATRGFLILIFVVIILRNYKQILAGLQSVSTAPEKTTTLTPFQPGGGSFGGGGASGNW